MFKALDCSVNPIRVDIREGGKPEYPEKNTRSTGENQRLYSRVSEAQGSNEVVTHRSINLVRSGLTSELSSETGDKDQDEIKEDEERTRRGGENKEEERTRRKRGQSGEDKEEKEEMEEGDGKKEETNTKMRWKMNEKEDE